MSTTRERLKDVSLNTDSPVIFEIGVHRGQDTSTLLNLFKNSTYYGFECDPRNIKFLKNNNITSRIHLIEMAISNKNGVAEFFQSNGTPPEHSRNNTASSSLHRPKKHLERWPWVTFDKSVTVKTCTLDSFCNDNNIDHVDFIWADVQGGEYNMILGGQQTLSTTKYLYTEYANVELYEGQKDMETLLDALPGEWRVVQDFFSDVLLQNLTLKNIK